MKTSITVNGNRFDILNLSVISAGHGHNTIRCNFISDEHGVITHSVTTNNTRLTDRMRDDNSEVEDPAKVEAAELVIENYLENIAQSVTGDEATFTYTDSEAGEQVEKFNTLGAVVAHIENFGYNGDSDGVIFQNGTAIVSYRSRENGLTWAIRCKPS